MAKPKNKTARKPAMKFAHLRKKMARGRSSVARATARQAVGKKYEKNQGLYVGSHATKDITLKFDDFVFGPFCKFQERDQACEFPNLEEAQVSKKFLDKMLEGSPLELVIKEE